MFCPKVWELWGSGCGRIVFESTFQNRVLVGFCLYGTRNQTLSSLTLSRNALLHLNSKNNLGIFLDLQLLLDTFVFYANYIYYWTGGLLMVTYHLTHSNRIIAMHCTWEILEDYPEASNDPECSSVSSCGHSLLCLLTTIFCELQWFKIIWVQCKI